MANKTQPNAKEEVKTPAETTPVNDDVAPETAEQPVQQEPAAKTPVEKNPAEEAKEDLSKLPSKDLRVLCESFEVAVRPMQDRIRDLKEQIAAAERREYEEKCDAEVRALIPGGNTALLDSHRFIFMIDNSNDGGDNRNQNGFRNRAVNAAFTTANRVTTAKADRKTVVKGNFWGEYGDLRLDPRFDGTDFNSSGKVSHKFMPAAKKILEMSTPDEVDGKKQNYVIICQGELEDNIEQTVAILEAAAGLNPEATFDFVVCNAAATAMDKLAKKFSETESGKNVNLIKVAHPREIPNAAVAALKARMEGKVHTPPAPALPLPAPRANKASVTAPAF